MSTKSVAQIGIDQGKGILRLAPRWRRRAAWRTGSPTSPLDEFFVTEQAAREGVVISNPSRTDPIVMLKCFGPGNPDLVL